MTTTVIDDLNTEWEHLSQTGRAADHLDDCIRRWPQLAPISEHLPATVMQKLDPELESDILLELLRQFDGGRGDYVAGRLVLQCMIPATIRLAARVRGRYQNLAECHTDAVAAMWRAIGEHDTTGAATPTDANIFFALRGRARALLLQDVRHRARIDIPIADDDIERLTHRSPSLAPDSPILGATGEVLELIAQGVDCNAITGAEASLLTRIYAPDPRDACDHLQATIAAEMGISHEALRARASRAVRRLARAVQDGRCGPFRPALD